MEPILDVFSKDAFSFVTLTDSINKLPFVPGRLGALGLFTEAPVPTTSIALEEQAGILTLANVADAIKTVLPQRAAGFCT